MEATFLNFCDENFTTLSHFCQKDEPDDPDSGLLDLIHDEFSYQASNFGVSSMDLWETEQESNSDSAVLPVTIPQEGSMSRIDHSNKEDFQKMLLDWQEHLGSLQVSDTEEIDAVPEQLPDNIFEDPVYESMFVERPIFPSVTSKLTPSISMKDDDINIYNLEELLDCADDNDDKLPIKIHEHVLRKMGQFKVDPVVKPEIKAEVKFESGMFETGGEKLGNMTNQRKNVRVEPRISVKKESYADCQFMKINNVNEQLATAEFAKGGSTVSEQSDCSELLNCDSLKMEEELLKTFPKIKVEPAELDLKLEVDEDCIDIETVSEQIPVLEAGDLKSLLEQFEASEAVSPNVATGTASPQQQMPADSTMDREEIDISATAATSIPSTTVVTSPIKPLVTTSSSRQQTLPNVTKSVATSVVSTQKAHTPAPHASTAIPSCLKISNSATRPLLKSLHSSHSVSSVSVGASQCSKDPKMCDRSSPSTSVASSGSSSPVSQPTTPPQSNHKIQESLSAALIEKLKASGRKKTIPVIPAMPTKRSGRGGTRMQDAGAALSRNKLLKIVAGGESIQLDHDYCSMSSGTVEAPRPFYHSDASEYSVAPNASLLLPQEQQLKHSSSTDCWENSSRKDSGLESGEVSDASEEAGGSSVVTSVDCGSGTVITTLKSTVTSAQIQPGTSLLRKSLNTGLNVANNTTSQKQKLKQFQQQRQQQLNQQIPQQQQQNFQKQQAQKQQQQQQQQEQQQQQQQQQQELQQKEQQPPSGQAQQVPKKRKLNLEEYRNRLKDRDRAKDTFIGTSRIISLDDIPMPPSNTAVEVNKKSTDSAESRVRPEMCNAEVQADVSKEMGGTSDTEKRLGRLRDHRHRQYRSKRHSSSSSSSSESSRSSSRSSRSSSYSPSRKPRRQTNRSRHRRSSRSRRRMSNKRRHSSASRSCSGSSSSRSSRGGSSSRSRSPFRGPRCRNISQISDREKQRQVEERRVIYVGRIDEGTSKAQLRKRFEVFGPIVDISVHFREHGDNYGFVTYMYKKDAYEAVEHGNDDPHLPQYDLCFGGRRAFCKTRYADLDGLATSNDSVGQFPARGPNVKSRQEDSFDLLLREAQATLRKRSKV